MIGLLIRNDEPETPEMPFTTTAIAPVVAPLGTSATIWVSLQLLIVFAAVPLKLSVLVPWVAPKFVPVTVTDVPARPEAGEKPVTLGLGYTVNSGALLACPFTVTTTLPVVAPAGRQCNPRADRSPFWVDGSRGQISPEND